MKTIKIVLLFLVLASLFTSCAEPKNFKDKKCIIENLKKYHLGYIVWKSLLHESVEDLDLELYLIE